MLLLFIPELGGPVGGEYFAVGPSRGLYGIYFYPATPPDKIGLLEERRDWLLPSPKPI
jgi:hypothetical protein